MDPLRPIDADDMPALRHEITRLRERLAQHEGAAASATFFLHEHGRRGPQVERLPMAVIEFDAEGIVYRWSAEAENLFGWRADEVLGRPVRELDFIHEDDLAGVREVAAQLWGGTGHVTWTNRNFTKDRRVVHCTWHNSRLPVADGGPDRVLSLVLDVTEHKRAEEALRASEERHRRLAETLQQGVVHQDTEGRIIAMNPAAERILGKSRERFLGSDSVREEHDTVREDGSVFPGELHPSMQALRDGRPVRGVVMGVWNPERAQRRWLRVDAVPVWRGGHGGPGRADEVYAVFEDITEQRLNEEALRAADRHKDLFIATLAHELRNPLAPILHAATVLRRQAPAGTASALCSAIIERQVGQMSRLLDDLLDVSRVASGRLLLRPHPLLLSTILEQAIETARPLIDAAGHTLSVRLPARPVTLHGDGVRLAQVCANLLTNAARYTPAGGRVDVDARVEGAEVVVSVRDSGIGLAPEHLHSVFEMFGQVDRAAAHSQGGMGIGLALARGLVEMHGGRIAADSAGPGCGSEFTLRLPLPAAAPVDTPVHGSPHGPADAAPPVAPRRILVVDDNEDAAYTLALLLGADGHQVETAHDGLAALARAAVWQPEVALLDLGLPGLSGFELCRALRQRPGGDALLVVAISGWGQDQDRRRTAEAGFDAHLVKPVCHDQLRALLARPAPAAGG